MPSWDEVLRATTDEIARDPDAWFRGYFRQSHDAGETVWRRDLDELRCRDLFLLALGNVKGQAILDVACGIGLFMVPLGLMGATVSGQDLSGDAVGQAQKALLRHGLSGCLKVGDATRLQFDDDFVEHITDEQKRQFFAEVFRVLRPGGVFAIKTPNLSYLRLSVMLKRLAAVATGRSPKIYILHTHGNPDNEHHGLTTYRRVRKALLQTRFHEPTFVSHPLGKRRLPSRLQYLLPRLPVLGPLFNQHLLVVARKPIFLGYFK
jgi:2-polyprenyl-3-methyl-5-hydroxy-6-metoxy-1,4-benzoquinol methylase